ncbi:MAG TPA: lactate racemase domain-containing protein [Vicinamibacterales bacterium]|nr:lactate racemase domain-containing protein [Vicinamibacterales bacterium]
MGVIGQGVVEGYLSPDALAQVLRDGLARLDVDGRRVIVLIPDGTRTMPMAAMFAALEREIGARVAALDYLVALGTHSPMNDEALTRLVGTPVVNGRAGSRRIFNHRWDDPATFANLGSIPAREIADITGGRLSVDVPVALNRLVVDYDHVLICGPVFPHEVVGFSGGTKYLFPGIAAAPIIHFTHWLGALITSTEVIGTVDTPVRAVINRAAALLDTPLSLLALVVTHDGVAGAYVGGVHEAWREAALLSSRRHIVWLDRPFDRMLAVMPEMYDDLWTAAKGAYKTETAVADGGEVIVYAPHVREVSYTHGRLIEEIGYHCRDYFLAQWDRFSGYPGGILAHSTHVKGLGTFDAERGVESPRITVTLATGIPRERCNRINLAYQDPARIDFSEWSADNEHTSRIVPRAGELLFRVGAPPGAPEVVA